MKKRMERKSKIILLTAISIITAIGLGTAAYAQTTRASTGVQCGAMSGMAGMGMMGGTSHTGMMGQSGDMQAQCQAMMGQHDMTQCQNMTNSQDMAQCQAMMSQQNMTQTCH